MPRDVESIFLLVFFYGKIRSLVTSTSARILPFHIALMSNGTNHTHKTICSAIFRFRLELSSSWKCFRFDFVYVGIAEYAFDYFRRDVSPASAEIMSKIRVR